VKLRIFTEPQAGAHYSDLRATALAAEDLGFDAFFRSDHYLPFTGLPRAPGPTDAWISLAGLAVETTRIRLGTLMSPVTFRFPGPFAVAVAQADQMSEGRVEVGIGAGWFEREHSAFGIPFPSRRERFDRLEEQLAVITGFWDAPEGQGFSFDGKHYQLRDSPGLPKPAQRPRPPILLGGKGLRRTPDLAARYADEFNVPTSGMQESARMFDRVRMACAAIGRNPLTMKFSVLQAICCGKTGAQFRSRASASGWSPDELRDSGLGGTPGEVAEKIAEFAEIGAERVYLHIPDLRDLDHLELVASAVAPQVSAL
jgi:F420-dependent oxidoreductase-like protein